MQREEKQPFIEGLLRARPHAQCSPALLQASQPAARICMRGEGRLKDPTVQCGRWWPLRAVPFLRSPSGAGRPGPRPQAHSLLGTRGGLQPLDLGLCPSSSCSWTPSSPSTLLSLYLPFPQLRPGGTMRRPARSLAARSIL